MRHILIMLLFLGSFEVFAEDAIETKKLSSPILIDVRTDDEWINGYIETAIHIPLDMILQNIELVTDNKDHKIYLYCRSGNRSGKAEEALQGIGYINAKNIGGIKEASSTLKLKITK